MQVPFVDLDAQYQSIKEEIFEAIQNVLETRKFIEGDFCESFEKNFCKTHGAAFARGCSNGTSAISVALRAMGIKPGDEIITVNNTFFATVEGICEAGATPVLVDCKADTYGIDIDAMEAAITEKTKAVIPVHLYGNTVAMDKVMEVAKKHNLKVLEDCAQAHLAKFGGQAVGTFGDFGTFSFYPGKNLGAYGDAGIVITGSEKQREDLCLQINHGRLNKYEHQILSGNYRMDGMQGAILDVKLKRLRDWTNARQEKAKLYDKRLKEAGFKVIETEANGECVYHLYVVEVSNRDEVMTALKAKGISVGIHYPIPMHLQPALKHLGYKQDDFPVSTKAASRILSLPIFPELTSEAVDYVITEFLKVARP